MEEESRRPRRENQTIFISILFSFYWADFANIEEKGPTNDRGRGKPE